MENQPVKRPVGRPPLEGVTKDSYLHCRVSHKRKEKLRLAAEARGTSMSQFVEAMIDACCKEVK